VGVAAGIFVVSSGLGELFHLLSLSLASPLTDPTLSPLGLHPSLASS